MRLLIGVMYGVQIFFLEQRRELGGRSVGEEPERWEGGGGKRGGRVTHQHLGHSCQLCSQHVPQGEI